MPLRVAHVITRLIVGGAQENTVCSVLGLREKADLEVNLIAGPTFGPEGSLERLVAEPPGLLTIVPELVRPVHPWKDVVAWRKLTERFRALRPQVVHTHSGKAGVLGRLAARKAGVPVIVHTIHGPSFGPFQGFIANAVFRAAEHRAAKATSHFVVVANAMRDQYPSAGIGTPQQYTRILSGFALEPFLTASNDLGLRKRLGISSDDIVIGTIARLTALKGHDDLLTIAPELIRSCPNLKFLLVGDGNLRGRFEARARQLGLEQQVVFAGLLTPDQVSSYVGIMDILVHLSLREGLARALPQALAAGKPVIAYDCDGAKEVCIDGATGFLLCSGDLVGLSARLLALAKDPQKRDDFGAKGKQMVREQFSISRMVDDLHQLYWRLACEAGVATEMERLVKCAP